MDDLSQKTSELRYRRLFETAKDGILILDFTTGMITDANKFLLDLIGFSKKNVLKKYVWEIGFFKNEDEQKANLRVLQKKGYVRFEDLPLETKDGRKIDVEFVANAYDVGGEKVIQCNVRDITDRVKAQKEAATSELRYRRLFETAKDGILILDFTTGMITDANKFLLDLVGFSKENVLKKYVWEIGFFKNEDEQKANLKILQKKGYVRFEDLPIETKDGRKIDVEFVANAYDVGGVKVIQCNIRDITERVIYRENLKRSEKRYRDIFEASQDSLMLLDEKGFFDCNQATLKLFGYDTVKEFCKNRPAGVSPPVQPDGTPSLELETKRIHDAFKYGHNSFEWMHRMKNGKDFPANVLLVAFELEGKKVLQATVRDITEQKRVQEKLMYSEDKFSKAFLNSPQAMLITRARDSKFVEVNDALVALTGYTKKEILASSALGLNLWVNAEDRVNFVKELSAGKALMNREYLFKAKNGRVLVGLVSSRKIMIDNEFHILTNISDITDSKVAEEQLKESEYLFRESQKVANIGSYKFNLLSNTWYSSEVLDKILGIDQNYVKTFESWLNIIHPSDRKMMSDYFTKFVLGMRQNFNKEYRIVRKRDGEIRWVSGLGKVNYDAQDKPISMYGTIMDVSERKASNEQNEWLASFPILDPNPILEIDENNGVTYINPVAKKLFPDIKRIGIDHPFVKGIHKYFKILSLLPNRLDTREVEINGRWYFQTLTLQSQSIIRLYSADITERINLDKKIGELNNRNESILASIGDAVVAVNKSGKIIVFNRVAEELIGVSLKDALGVHYKEILHFVSEKSGNASVDFINSSIFPIKNVEMENHILLVRKDGEKIPIADVSAQIKDANDELIGYVIVFHDMTRERKIDKAKTEFVSLASHQLRTPLSTINWYSEILLSEDLGKLTPKQRQYNLEVYHASQRMVALVNALLNVSRLELGTYSVDPKSVNLTKLVKNCITDLVPIITTKKLVVTERYGRKMKDIKVDSKLMTIIIQNLLSNSVKYSKEGGKIQLAISTNENNMIITVSDQGIGIPKDQQKEIFSKLYRADNAKRMDPDGTGLGLYIVKEIIEYTGGKVWFTSSLGKGTTFYASLPMSGMIKKVSNKQLI